MEQNVTQINGGTTINVEKECEKEYVWNPSTCVCENGKYLASIMDDLEISCDEVIKSYDEEVKTIPTNFNIYI